VLRIPTERPGADDPKHVEAEADDDGGEPPEGDLILRRQDEMQAQQALDHVHHNCDDAEAGDAQQVLPKRMVRESVAMELGEEPVQMGYSERTQAA
jgi:hypothetical protein